MLKAEQNRDTVISLFSYILEGAVRYPNITRAHVHDMFNGRETINSLAIGFKPMLEKLTQLVQKQCGLEHAKAQNRTMHAISAIMFPSLFSNFYSPINGLESQEDRRKYIEEVVQALLKEDNTTC